MKDKTQYGPSSPRPLIFCLGPSTVFRQMPWPLNSCQTVAQAPQQFLDSCLGPSTVFRQLHGPLNSFQLMRPLGHVSYCHHFSSVNISHFNPLLRNHWANCNQTLVEWSLDGPLPNVCRVIPTSNQDGRQAKIRKKGG